MPAPAAPLRQLRVAVLLGSTRTEGPPSPANLGSRVGKFLQAAIPARGMAVDVVDPVEEDLPLLRRCAQVLARRCAIPDCTSRHPD
eukprot:SAG22_NODE_425_length_10628_cov_3.420458_2_plen_86_part_00